VIASLTSERINPWARVLAGSLVLLTGSASVTAINFAYNVSVARFLGVAAFGHASAVYTLLILLSAVTLSFQIVSAKVVAKQASPEAKSAAYRIFQTRAWISSIFLALGLVLLDPLITQYLNLPTTKLVLWLAVGVAFYVPLGSRRGYLQGSCDFRRLAGNMVLEASSRLLGSLLFITLGFGVVGVVAANACGIAIAYYFALPVMPKPEIFDLHIPDAFREALQAIVFFTGQVVINNCDIAIVKHFFAATPAGIYAAVALVGRVIFSFSWAVAHTMFPISAAAQSQNRRTHEVLTTALLLVFGLGSVLTLVLRLAPPWIWSTLFGSQFVFDVNYDVPHLLGLYAAATCIYSLSVVIIAYEMSYRIANTAWVQLMFSGVVIAGIYVFHSSLQEVILVQMVLMALLLAVVAVPFLKSTFAAVPDENANSGLCCVQIIRRVSEDEVIAEFLKNDFYNPEFEDYQESMGALVSTPDFNDPRENARRRALLFLRHGALWRELPKDTEWFDIELQPPDLEQVRVFPRAQWRKVAQGDFGFNQVLRSLQSTSTPPVEPTFLAKIWDLRDWLTRISDAGAVLLIGVSEQSPLTILDGNHRLVAAALTSPNNMRKLRFLCGLSPNMARCCWYRTNLATLSRYGVNLLRHITHDPEAEITRLLQSSS